MKELFTYVRAYCLYPHDCYSHTISVTRLSLITKHTFEHRIFSSAQTPFGCLKLRVWYCHSSAPFTNDFRTNSHSNHHELLSFKARLAFAKGQQLCKSPKEKPSSDWFKSLFVSKKKLKLKMFSKRDTISTDNSNNEKCIWINVTLLANL